MVSFQLFNFLTAVAAAAVLSAVVVLPGLYTALLLPITVTLNTAVWLSQCHNVKCHTQHTTHIILD